MNYLLARRLIEVGVPFVEIAAAKGINWDTHVPTPVHHDNYKKCEVAELW